jgi:hypothetical protein
MTTENLWSGVNLTIGNTNSVTSPLFAGARNTQGAASTYSTNQIPVVIPTNVIPFNPSTTANFQFQATFNLNIYNIIVNWNIYGERYYVNISDINNTLVVSLPLIGSPLNYNISLTAGYFTTQLVYREPSRQFEVI